MKVFFFLPVVGFLCGNLGPRPLQGRGRSSKDKCMFLLYLHAISVVNSKHTLTDGCSGLQIEFSTKVQLFDQLMPPAIT